MALLALDVPQQTSSSFSTTRIFASYRESSRAQAHPDTPAPIMMMADISNLPVKRPCCVETTALGAAYLAGLAVGYWSSTEDVLQNWSVDREFMPGIPDDERTRRLKGWNKAVRCSYGWAKEE